ncbi:major facilitator superfamily transporter like protein [Zymoseptoria brevis]|uniref:Major facilitator superfamily transporter like protein n=1 Tax=Zymoseptoria brevis TaxID=1047168 RepID=A0A0F4GQ82_9PEZI|nr:major facilitator superfamily transporter like protein [Zymoseptoria brevis]
MAQTDQKKNELVVQTIDDEAATKSLPSDDEITTKSRPASTEQATVKVPWWSYIWDYEPGRSKEEVAFVRRLDIFVLTILSLGYFIKNLDQTNIANAYVSGMKEDLSMNKNEINLIDVAWTCGYVVGQIPSQILLTKIRPSIWIPSCELAWTVLTFSLAAVASSQHVVAIRFFVGLFESIFYPAAHTILGSWYKPSELAKRACIFHASSALAQMFSGYLQAGVYKGLNGAHGLPGWKWREYTPFTKSATSTNHIPVFIMDGIISLPIACAGFFLIPDLPENSRAFYLTPAQVTLGRERMESVGRAPRKHLGWFTWKRIFGSWHVYLLTLLYIIFINVGPSSSVNPFAIWLKSESYPISLVNIIPTAQAAVQFVLTVSLAIVSDYYRNRAGAMTIATAFGLAVSIVLAIWHVPKGAKWWAFIMFRAYVPYGPLAMAWAKYIFLSTVAGILADCGVCPSEICSSDAEERSIVIGMMNSFGHAVQAWLPYLTFPGVDSPRFLEGWIFSTCAFVAQGFVTWTVWAMFRRDRRKKVGQA